MTTLLRKKFPVLLMLAMTLAMAAPAFAKGKLKIFILAGQSNMLGHSSAHTMATLFDSSDPRDKKLAEMMFKKGGAVSKKLLDEQIARAKILDELTGGLSKRKKITDAAKVARLKAAYDAFKKGVFNACVVSDRVYINSLGKSGKLTYGYGAYGPKIGPEYAFGLSMAERIDGPILLIKTSWGGKSLHYNFRPPSAGAYVLSEKQKSSGKADEVKKKAGLNYRMMNKAVHKVLNNLKAYHPAYDRKAGYEIAGFVWFQGYNDQFSRAFRDNYASNMIAFIKDIRTEYKTPKMPFVIGVMGTSKTKENVAKNAVSVGQRKAAQAPEFKGNVLAVESYVEYDHDAYKVYKAGWAAHYHHWDIVGSDRPYHYLGSGKFFARLGDSFANAMAGLIAKQSGTDERKSVVKPTPISSRPTTKSTKSASKSSSKGSSKGSPKGKKAVVINGKVFWVRDRE